MREPVLLLRAGPRRFALPVRLIDEVMRPLPLVETPGAPAFVIGESTIRGNLFAVVDLRRVLSIEQPAPPARMLTLRLPATHIAIVVDEVMSVQNDNPVGREEMASLLAGASEDLIDQIEAFDSGLLMALRTGEFIPARSDAAGDTR